MQQLIARLLVILRAAPTYLVALAMVLTIVADELPDIPGIPAEVLTVIARIITVIGVAVAIIRRVTPVVEQARGLLPPAELPRQTGRHPECRRPPARTPAGPRAHPAPRSSARGRRRARAAGRSTTIELMTTAVTFNPPTFTVAPGGTADIVATITGIETQPTPVPAAIRLTSTDASGTTVATVAGQIVAPPVELQVQAAVEGTVPGIRVEQGPITLVDATTATVPLTFFA